MIHTNIDLTYTLLFGKTKVVVDKYDYDSSGEVRYLAWKLLIEEHFSK